MDDKLVVKKYANRRLYDTEKSRYVTLSELADSIKRGRKIEVLDAKTKEDVTSFILTQIIFEEAKNKNALLPVPLLHLIIRYGENILSEFFDKYLQQIIRNYVAYKGTLDDQFSEWLDMGMNLSEIAQKGMVGFPPFQSFMGPFSDSKDEKED